MLKNYSRIAYSILAVAFVLRFFYVWMIHPIDYSIYSDMGNYVYVADLIAKGEWRATHFFQPIGFPLLIWFLKANTTDWYGWLELIHVITSTLTLWFIWQLTKKSFGEKLGLGVLILSTLHLPWIVFAGLCLSENCFIFFLSLLAWLGMKIVYENKSYQAITWSLAFLLAILFKGTHVFLGPLFLIGLYFLKRREALRPIILISVFVGSGLLLHGAFAKSKMGKFQMSGSAGGLNFVEGKCPSKNNADSAGYSWFSPLFYQLGLNTYKKWDRPFTDSSYFMQQGWECIKKNPYVLVQSLEGIPFLFMGNTLWPANQLKQAGFIRLYELAFAFFSIVGIIVFLRFLKYSPSPWEDTLLWLIPISSVFLCVYIFKSEIRFRIPFDVWIIPVSLKGWSDLLRARFT